MIEYSKFVLDHYRNPRNFGILEKPTHRAYELNPLCGDEITVYLKIKNNLLQDIKYRAQGCALSIAAASVLSESIKNKPIIEIERLAGKDIEELLGIKVSPARKQCTALALNAVKKTLAT
ncbi:MAG: iron-sulfur cluster assembly scaffold protein [Candidatus Doudnabacteria bacterium]|nr:iron-sulfur cluster assembly scaffold protein [Candidatus Doudnabacteria bacterium]